MKLRKAEALLSKYQATILDTQQRIQAIEEERAAELALQKKRKDELIQAINKEMDEIKKNEVRWIAIIYIYMHMFLI